MPGNTHEWRIQRLLNEYAYAFDSGDFDRFAALFEHGTLHLQGVWPAATGSAAVRELLDNRVILYDGSPRTNHLMHNVIVDVDEGSGTATASVYVQVLQALDDFPIQTVATGIYRDRLRLAGDGWQFVERVAHGSLRGDLSRHLRRRSR